MKVTDNVGREPFTHQRDMKAGDAFSWNGQPWMMTVFGPNGNRYTLHLRDGTLFIANPTENEVVVALTEAEVLLHGSGRK